MVILLLYQLYKHHFFVNCSSLLPRFFSAFKTNMAAREHFTEETRLFYSIQRLFICWKVFRNHLNKCMEVLGLLNLTEMICEKDSHVGTL